MIKGKSAIVTGSTSGIGLGIATALAEQGCNLLLNGFGDQGEIEKLRAGLADKHRIKVAYSPADMSKPADIRAMVALAEKELGACDILVNNAGIQFVAPIEDFPDEKWDAIIAINLSASYHAKQEGISIDKAKENLLKEKQPMLKFSTPEDLGALTVFLCGDAAETITGTTVSMDGGWTAQ